MSSVQPLSSSMQTDHHPQEPSWAEEFIDLTQFCQFPSTPTPIKMEDLVDDHVPSPYNRTVHDQSLDYILNPTDPQDDGNYWCMPSPAINDDLANWLAATDDRTNNAGDLFASAQRKPRDDPDDYRRKPRPPVQSPSVTQSVRPNIAARRQANLSVRCDEKPDDTTTLDTPEMLQLVNKHQDFDIVSYVFDSDKPLSLDLSSAPEIKVEPKEELTDEPDEERHDSTRPKITLRDRRRVSSVSSRGKRRRSSYTSEDDIAIESEKYRELRTRNNEASRRSRANRKTREVEMREHAAMLEAENNRLKVKAEEMERLVKRLRECLMQLVLMRR